ncbi:MAG: hypothetical protein ACLQVI_21085, partial [Polyangiaceae bacterium]
QEEELDDLPPIDGDSLDPEGAEEDSAPEELDDDPSDAEADPLDDSTGEGDPLEEVETSGAESGWLDDAGDSEALDVGTPDTFGTEDESPTLLEGAEEPDVGEDELTFGAEGSSDVGDAGEEGFEDEEEDLREEDLPRLDSGQDDAEPDDADLLDALPEENASEEPRPPWDDRAWERVEEGASSSLSPAAVLAIGPSGLVVGGEGLARVDREGGLTVLGASGLRGGAPHAIAVTGTTIYVATPRGGVFISDDGGSSFREGNAWRALLGPGEHIVELLCSGDERDELWGRGSGGSLVWSEDQGITWSRVLPELRFEAIAADTVEGCVVALARKDGATSIARGSRGRLVSSKAGTLPGGKVLTLAAYDGKLAVALVRGAFRLDGSAGMDWTRLDGSAGLTAMTFARSDGSLVLALYSEAEGRAWILEARANAPALTVAEMGDAAGTGANDDGDGARIRALCWDGGTGVVWAAGAFGLIALRPARR